LIDISKFTSNVNVTLLTYRSYEFLQSLSTFRKCSEAVNQCDDGISRQVPTACPV